MPDRIDSGYVEFYPQFNQAAARAATAALASSLTSAMDNVERRLSSQMASAGAAAGRSFNRGFRQTSSGGLFDLNVAGSSKGEMDKVASNIKSFLSQTASSATQVESTMARMVTSVTSGMRGLAGGLDHAAKSFGFLSQSIGIAAFQMQILGFAMTSFVSGPLAALGVGMVTTGLKAAAGIEQSVNGIKALVGKEQQQNVVDFTARMVELARISPVFESEAVLKFAQNLVAAGQSLPEAERMIRSLGNIGATLGVSADKMNLAFLAIEQMAAKGGKTSLEELRRQLGDALPGALKIVADAMGVTTEQLYKMVKQGLPATEVLEALKRAGESPQFMQGAISGATSLNGIWQQFKETIKTTLAFKFLDENFRVRPEIIEGIKGLTTAFDSLIKGIDFGALFEGFTRLVENVQNLIAKYQSLSPEQKGLITDILKIAVVAGPAAIVLGYVGTAISGILSALKTGSGLLSTFLSTMAGLGPLGVVFTGVALAIAGVVAGLAIFVTQTEEGRKMLKGFVDEMKRGWEDSIKPALDSLLRAVRDDLLPALSKLLQSLGIKDWEEFGRIVGGIVVGQITFLIEALKLAIQWITYLADATRDQIDFMKAKWDLLKEIGSWFDREVVQPVLGGIQKVKDAFSGVFSGGLNLGGLSDSGIGSFLDGIKTKITTFVDDVQAAWNRLTEITPQVFSKIASDISAAWDNVIQPALQRIKEAFQAFWTGLFEGTTTDQGGIAGAFGRIGEALNSAWENVIKPTLDRIKTGFQEAMSTLFEEGGAGGSGIASAFGRIGDALQAAWNDRIKPALDGLKESLANLWTSVQPAFEDLRTAWDGLSKAWSDAWNNSIKPVLDELKGMLSGLWTDAQPIFDNIRTGWDAVAKIFGDSAPQFTTVKDAIKALWDIAKPFLEGMAALVGGVLVTQFQGFVALLSNVVIPALALFIETGVRNFTLFVDTVTAVFRGVQTVLDGFGSFITTIGQTIDGFITGVSDRFNKLRTDVTVAWDGIRSDIENAWNSIRTGVFEPLMQFVSVDLLGAFTELRSRVTEVWNGIRTDISSAWDNIRTSVFDPLKAYLSNDLFAAFTKFRDDVVSAWNALKDGINAAYIAIRDTVFAPLKTELTTLQGAFNAMKDQTVGILNLLRDGAVAMFVAIRDTVFTPMKNELTTLQGAFNAAKDTIVGIVNLLRDGVKAAWESIRTQSLQPAIDFVKGPFVKAFDDAKNSVVGIFVAMGKGIASAFDGIINNVVSQVGRLIGFVNAVIDIINKIPFITKIDKLSVPGAPAAGGRDPQRSAFRARGGPVEGGPPGIDTVPAIGPKNTSYRLDNGEHILTRKEVNKMGGHAGVYAFRRQILKTPQGMVNKVNRTYRDGVGRKTVHMVGGGRVGPDNDALLNDHRDHVHVAMSVPPMGFPLIIAKAATSGIPHSVGSTFRPGSRGSGGGLDHHSEGRAVDFPGFEQDKFASWWESQAGVIELIHRTNARDYAIFGGGTGGSVVSWLMTAAGKAMKKLLEGAVNVLNAAVPGDGNAIVPNTVKALFGNMGKQALGYFDAQAGGAAATPEQLKKWIDEAGKHVNIEWVQGLVTLIMRESGGNPRAINLTDDNAKRGTPSKGLMQTIDPTFQSYRDKSLPNDPFDPIANIVAGMNYVHGRYGSLHSVQQAHAELPPQGYDSGGYLGAGATLAFNGTGSPEAVFTQPQWDILKQATTSNTGGTLVNVYVDGVRRDAKIEVEALGKETARILNAGGRG